MAEYKLTIVVREKRVMDGKKSPSIIVEREIVTIGYFKTERELQQWAEDNLDKIDKA